jgi:DNA-binding NarL/FixJ family response regulator
MIRVIIVEDDPLVQQRFEAVLAPWGDLKLVGSAATKSQGSTLIAAGGYDVLVCDLGLPDGDGTDLVKQSALQNPAADIMVLTMFADHHKVLAAIKAGARGYVLKDQSLEDCVAAIRDVCSGGSPISPIIARLLLNELGLGPTSGGKTILGTQKEPKPVPIAPEATCPLSEREIEALNLLARGFTYSECADLLGISAHTVGSHVKNIYRKLEVSSRAEAVFEASSLGILDTH